MRHANRARRQAAPAARGQRRLCRRPAPCCIAGAPLHDLAEGQPNLASNLILNAGLAAREAVARLVRMHDEGVRELDDVASDLEASDSIVARWVRDLRFATLGFTVWESQAPRYAEHKVIVGDEVIEPLLFAPPGGRRDVIRVDRSAGAREADERAE